MKNTLIAYLFICVPSYIICLFTTSGGVLLNMLRVHIADQRRPFQEFHPTPNVYEGSSRVVRIEDSLYIEFQFSGVLRGNKNRYLSILVPQGEDTTGNSDRSFLILEDEDDNKGENESLLICLVGDEDNVNKIFNQYANDIKRFKKCPTILVLVKHAIPPPPQRLPSLYSDLSLWLKKDQSHCDNFGNLRAGALFWVGRFSSSKWVRFDKVDSHSKLKLVQRNPELNKLKAMGYILAIPLDFILSPVYIVLFFVLLFTGNFSLF